MRARLSAWLERLGDQFWLRPALLILLGLGLGQTVVWCDEIWETGAEGSGLAWSYAGGAEGARSLLSAIASSTIGVAGTVFSITIAALSLASNQMGPRLLRNFVRDSRNQYALGIFLGTHAYALIVLRTVRTVQETAFVPHLAVSGAILLALVSLGTLVWFVHHVATSINVETVIDAVHGDLCRAIDSQTLAKPDIGAPAHSPEGPILRCETGGYLQAIDLDGLADWAHAQGVRLHLWVRPGDYVPMALPVAQLSAGRDGAQEALRANLTFGRQPAALQNLEYAIHQLSEIAVRALSPGINDPFTAASVLAHFGDALCRIAPRHLMSGAVARDGTVVATRPVTDYNGLCDAMFHVIRQNAADSPYVLIRLVEVLTDVARVERRIDRLAELQRHADLVMASCGDGLDPSGREDLAARHRRFLDVVAEGGAP
ncbi:DUF2254 domain-containing protein [Methylobacterium terricola]|uniref:DUF2254 domain-containing protein n=1 Tax=Methylobacterium terricola TaxID=2583531 RepID=A0A5C4LJW8_9HYPH|nr:DUF2254 domain-containing protein [Methylobacterium terricola]TNC12687.1 DUF2254 domain-containing protein [Methylobacterium terricola]